MSPDMVSNRSHGKTQAHVHVCTDYCINGRISDTVGEVSGVVLLYSGVGFVSSFLW